LNIGWGAGLLVGSRFIFNTRLETKLKTHVYIDNRVPSSGKTEDAIQMIKECPSAFIMAVKSLDLLKEIQTRLGPDVEVTPLTSESANSMPLERIFRQSNFEVNGLLLITHSALDTLPIELLCGKILIIDEMPQLRRRGIELKKSVLHDLINDRYLTLDSFKEFKRVALTEKGRNLLYSPESCEITKTFKKVFRHFSQNFVILADYNAAEIKCQNLALFRPELFLTPLQTIILSSTPESSEYQEYFQYLDLRFKIRLSQEELKTEYYFPNVRISYLIDYLGAANKSKMIHGMESQIRSKLKSIHRATGVRPNYLKLYNYRYVANKIEGADRYRRFGLAAKKQ
jgi:hypothetical protein